MKRPGASLVIGADGLIGRALADHLVRIGETVIETTRRRDTLSEKRIFLDAAGDVSDWRPPGPVSVAYLCAAVTSIERCRQEPMESANVNVHNTGALAKRLAASGTFVIFPSTNFVYDGSIPFRKAEDPVCPVTEYGRQRAEVERQLLSLGDLISIVRITKVIGPNMPLFKEWIQALQRNETIHPFTDKILSPVPLSFAVEVLHQTGLTRISGILQISASKDITYAQLGYHLAQRMRVDLRLVKPIAANPVPYQEREHHTTLDTTRLVQDLGMKPPGVWSAVESLLTSQR
jgi:dTDP-4-dehydrorhamnose reductase